MHVPKLGWRIGHWRTLIKPAAVAALGLSVVGTFAFGRVEGPRDALMKFVLGYPLWFIILCLSVAPGIYLVKRLRINALWALPSTGVLLYVLLGAAKNWPPGPPAMLGAMSVPSGYFLGFPIEWWKAYLYNLWPYAFFPGIGAVLFLIVHRAMRGDQAF
jgi:hypothetical protein